MRSDQGNCLGHVGTFRVKARVYMTPSGTNWPDTISVRFRWQDGKGPLRANAWQSRGAPFNVFSELDLGTIGADA